LGVLRISGHEKRLNALERYPTLAVGSSHVNRLTREGIHAAVQSINLKLLRASLGDLQIEASEVSWPTNLTIPRTSLGDLDPSTTSDRRFAAARVASQRFTTLTILNCNLSLSFILIGQRYFVRASAGLVPGGGMLIIAANLALLLTSVKTRMGKTRWMILPCCVMAAAAGLYFVSSGMIPLAGFSRNSHQAMIRTLAKIRDKDLADNPLYSRAVMEKAKLELEALSKRSFLEERIDSHSHVGGLQLLLGDNRAAAKNLVAAHEMLLRIRSSSADAIAASAGRVGIAYLRCGEQENCIEQCTCESCILPIRDGGIHTKQDGSRAAMPYLLEALGNKPDDLKNRWLLNIAAMTVGEYPDKVPSEFLIPPTAFESDIPFPRFTNVAVSAGVDTLSLAGGVVADDFDGDGRLDLITSDWAPTGQIRFFKNAGTLKFVEATQEAGLLGLLGGLNLVPADYDNDGDLDVLVLRGAWRGENGRHPKSLLQNDGHAKFRDVTFDVGLGQSLFPTQTASWGDFDNDGDLDLYIGNEQFASELYQNDGHGKFTNVAAQAGVTNDRFTKGVIWGDYNGDRFPDLYVSNYGQPERLKTNDNSADDYFLSNEGAPNRLYRNNRDGTFTDVAAELGATKPLLGFPTWFWDVNNDGHLDIFAASYSGLVRDVAAEYLGMPHQAENDCLYLSNGQGGFKEVGQAFGLHRVTLAMGANFGDLDNDSFDDFYLGTGAPEYESLVPNVMYYNQGGKSFAEITTAGGFGHLQKGHAVAFADLDEDGDQEVFAVIGGAYGGDTFRNVLFANPGFGNHWLKLRLVGNKSNRSAIGARIQIDIEDDGQTRSIYKWVNSGGSFGANPLRREIGLGQATKISKLKVYWPTTDKTQEFDDVPIDSSFEVVEGEDGLKTLRNGTPSG
jgi:hypothetical protein